MGCGASSETLPADPVEKKKDAQVGMDLEKDSKESKKIMKLLLLGPGEAGKSTFFKQMVIGHGGGIPKKLRDEAKPAIQLNCMEFVVQLGDFVQKRGDEYKIDKLADESLEIFSKFKEITKGGFDGLTTETAELITKLWRDPSIQKAWEDFRSKIQVPESAEYFLSNVASIAKPDYVPSDKDMLLLRVRTTGIHEQMFEIEGVPFLLVDVGGQRSERKKWINCFSDVTAILFLAPIGEYDQRVFEDETANRLQEALSLFQDTVNKDALQKPAFVLFFNKFDIFEQKIKKIPITECFPDYSGPATAEDVALYIQEEFLKTVTSPTRRIFTHMTSATDTEKTLKVFKDVRQSIITASLHSSDIA